MTQISGIGKYFPSKEGGGRAEGTKLPSRKETKVRKLLIPMLILLILSMWLATGCKNPRSERLIQSATKGAKYLIEKHIYTPLAIWTFGDGYDATGEARFLEAARMAAKSTTSQQRAGKFIEPAYSIIGLVKLYDLTKDTAYLDAAKEAGKYIIESGIYKKEDPIIPFALYCLTTKDPEFREALEFSIGGFIEKGLKTSLFNASVGKAMVLFHKNIEPNEKYYEETVKYGDWILSTQDGDNAYVDPKYGKLVHINARVYCLCYIPMLTELTGDEKYLRSGIKSAQWVMNTQLYDGAFPSSESKEADLESTLWATLANFRLGYYLRTGKYLGNGY